MIPTDNPTLVADNLHEIDFKNFSYPYRFWYGRNVHIALKNGEHEYDIKKWTVAGSVSRRST